MSWISYKSKAEKLAKRIERIYHMIGGDFMFFWVDDTARFKLSYTATVTFADALADQGAEVLSVFFHEAYKDKVTGNAKHFNLWSTIGTRNYRNFIVTGPDWDHISSKRKATERQRQPKYIRKDLAELKKEGFPFVFFYRQPKRPGTEEQSVICEVFRSTCSRLGQY